MSKRILSLAVLLCFAAALQLLVKQHASIIRGEPIPIETSQIPHDPESRFAAGRRISRSEIDAYALSLIPGFSDKLNSLLLDAINNDNHLQLNQLREGQSVFESIKGIGPQRAKILENYISP